MRQSIRKSISDAVEAQIEVMAITDILHAIGFRTGGSVSGDVQRLATALGAAEVEVGRLMATGLVRPLPDEDDCGCPETVCLGKVDDPMWCSRRTEPSA